MISRLPRLRGDLSVSRQAGAEGAVFVIKDPRDDQFYRLPEEAYFVACQLDGATPLGTLRQRVEERFGTPVSPGELGLLVHQLDVAGLLEGGRNGEAKRPKRRLEGSLLYARFRLFDPDRLFNWLVGRLGFFFTPRFVGLSAVVILAGVCVMAANWEEARRSLSGLYRLSALPVVSLVVFLIIIAHEFGHGLTCKHFGGEVHEMGFLLIYFQPAFYCNVSDAWLFPEKAKRLWVGFAGPYFELFIWGLATLLWRLTDVETTLNKLAFIVVTTSGVKTLVNFNPLIKLDGYYLLSDWLGIPNLRKQGFACVRDAFRRLFTWNAAPTVPMSRRERRACLVYGLAATVGSLSVLGYAFSKLGRYLLVQRQPLAFLFFAGLLTTKMRSRFGRLFGRPSSTPALAYADGLSEAPGGAELEDRPPPAAQPELNQPQRMSRFLKGRLKFALIGGPVLALLAFGRSELRVRGPFDVLPIHNADVRTAVEGIVEDICVDEGSRVRRGDTIARLDDRDLRADLERTLTQIDQGRAKLKLLEAGPRPEEIQLATNAVARAEEQLRFLSDRVERDRKLYEEKLLSLNDYEESERETAACRSDLRAARERLALLLAGSRPEDIDAMRAALAGLETERRNLETQLRLMRVVSPADGIVATPERELQEMKHQFVKKGDLIAKVYDLKTITAEIPISERDIADVRVGQGVVLKVRAYPEVTFHGKVTAIATAAQISPTASTSATALVLAQPAAPGTLSRSAVAPKTIMVTTEIDNPALLLKPEMTGQAKIVCGRRNLWQLITRRIVRTVKVEFWSWL